MSKASELLELFTPKPSEILYGKNEKLKVAFHPDDKFFDEFSDLMAGSVGKKIQKAIDDLELLAEANYGEDKMGNSTPLPDKLSYLRQDG